MSAARFLVSGRVQGVFFRASTLDQAQRLGLRWLQHGPPMARVERVEREGASKEKVGTGFVVDCE